MDKLHYPPPFQNNKINTPLHTHLGIPRARFDEEVERLLVTSSGVLAQRPVHQEKGDASVLYLVVDSAVLL